MKKEIVKGVRLTQEQAAILKEQANMSGMSEADYLRMLLTQKPTDYPEIREEMRELINEVNRVGVNINEVVHNNNSMLYSEDDKDRLIAYMRKLNELMNKKVKEIGNH